MSKADLTSNTPSRRATLLGAVAITSASVVAMGSAKASTISPALQKAFDEWQALAAIERKKSGELDAAETRLSELKPACPEAIRRENNRFGIIDMFGHEGDFAYCRDGLGGPDGPSMYATPAGFRRIIQKCTASESVTDYQLKRKAEAERRLALSEEYEAAISAAYEMTGFHAASAASNKAFNDAHDAFVRFIRIRPQTMSDVQFQAVHVVEWCEDGDSLEEFVLDWMKSLALRVS